jgi:hypothetical protein
MIAIILNRTVQEIAGIADTDKGFPYYPKIATGFGVRLLPDYLSGLE